MSAQVDHSQALTDRILARLRKLFYEGHEKLFYQELFMLKEAICLPAIYLDKRSRELPAKRLESIILTVIRGIVENAKPEQIHSFGRYFLKAVQTHMDHHGEGYLTFAKSYQSTLENALMGLGKLAGKPVEIDKTCQSLAAAKKLLETKSGRKKKLQNTQRKQLDLL